MKFTNALVGVFLAAFASSPLTAAEVDVPTDSIGSLGVYAALQKFQIASDVCSALHPEERAEYAAMMSAFSNRMKRLGDEVLATIEFKSLKNQPVPPSLLDAFRKDFQNTRRMHLANRASLESCRDMHDNFFSASDSHWKTGIAGALTELRETGKPFAPAPSGDQEIAAR